MGDVKAVPAGKYGKAALESLGVWASVEAKVAQAENVRAALKLVSTGEAALGIVYATDAVAEPGVKVIGTFPEDTHPPIVYPVGLTGGIEECGRRRIPEIPAIGEGQGAVRGAGLHLSGAGRLELRRSCTDLMEWLDLTPDEWNAVRLSIKVAIWAMVASLPLGILIALRAGARPLLGKIDPQRRRASAAGAAAGRDRLSPAARLRQARADRRLPRRAFRHRLLLPLDGRGAGLRRHGLSR